MGSFEESKMRGLGQEKPVKLTCADECTDGLV